MYIHYTLYKTTEDDLQNLSFNDVEEISYDVSDTTLNEHLKKIRDDFKSQEVISFLIKFSSNDKNLKFLVI